MRASIRNLIILLVMVVSLMAVQSVWAESCNVTVSGDITAINYDENAITVVDTTVYRIPLNYLANKLGIALSEGDYVVVTANQCPSTGRLTACTISVNDGDVITLPGARYQ